MDASELTPEQLDAAISLSKRRFGTRVKTFRGPDGQEAALAQPAADPMLGPEPPPRPSAAQNAMAEQLLQMAKNRGKSTPVVPSAGITGGRIDKDSVRFRALQDYHRFGNGGVVLSGGGGGAAPDPYADTPEDVARKAAMSKLKLRGETADTGFGSRRTVGRPLVKGASGEEKAALEEALSNDKRIASRAAQGDQARKNLAAYADGSKKRPHHVTEAERKADGRQLMADREAALVKAQMAPYLDYVRAQHPDNPHHVAAANKDNAIAAAIRAQMTQEAPGPGAMPGAASEPAAVPPGGATSAGLGGTSIPRGPGTYLPPHPTTGMEVLPPWGRDGTNIRKRPKPTVPVEPGIDYSLPGF